MPKFRLGEVAERITVRDGRPFVYRFPYETDDPKEIAYLRSLGASEVLPTRKPEKGGVTDGPDIQ